MRSFEVRAIGRVASPLIDLEAAPRQPDEGAPAAWLEFDEDVIEGLLGIQPGDQILVITWLDRARRDVLRVHPRGDPGRAPAGVFSTRSAHRPNPLGLHQVEVSAIDGRRLGVRSLEAVDGTPIVDLKPVLADEISRR